LTPTEEASLKLEYDHLDEAWRSNQENPMLYFRPSAREALAPLHLPISAKSLFQNKPSPIGKQHSEDSQKKGEASKKHDSDAHPERIPLFPICSRKCMKCERVLVKPSVEGGSLAPNTSLSADANAFSALPDFKRRHTALSFTPMIDVQAANAFEDYKPTLDFDNWNMISLTISNPPFLPVIHISLMSSSDKDESTSAPDDPAEETDTTLQKQTKMEISSSSPSFEVICQVDCNGCETWILEDEPIQLDDMYGEGEEKPEPAAWLSHPGVPAHLQLLESDTENPAIISRKSRQVTMAVLVMPDSKKFKSLKKSAASSKSTSSQQDQASTSSNKNLSSGDEKPPLPPIVCEMILKVSWPSPTEEQPELRHELTSPFRINMSKLFEVPE
jgi:hypothetical protein